MLAVLFDLVWVKLIFCIQILFIVYEVRFFVGVVLKRRGWMQLLLSVGDGVESVDDATVEWN